LRARKAEISADLQPHWRSDGAYRHIYPQNQAKYKLLCSNHDVRIVTEVIHFQFGISKFEIQNKLTIVTKIATGSIFFTQLACTVLDIKFLIHKLYTSPKQISGYAADGLSRSLHYAYVDSATQCSSFRGAIRRNHEDAILHSTVMPPSQ